MPDTNSKFLQMITPDTDPMVLDWDGGGTKSTLSGLLDSVPVDQALEILKVYYLKTLSSEVSQLHGQAAQIVAKLERMASES